MIDPKFNLIPVEEVPLTEEEREALMHQKPQRGLSINDTIAHDADLSVGATGVDTSGVRSGAGSTEISSITATDEEE